MQCCQVVHKAKPCCSDRELSLTSFSGQSCEFVDEANSSLKVIVRSLQYYRGRDRFEGGGDSVSKVMHYTCRKGRDPNDPMLAGCSASMPVEGGGWLGSDRQRRWQRIGRQGEHRTEGKVTIYASQVAEIVEVLDQTRCNKCRVLQ
uniref:Uncharacterized protein n=1 Tax=Photinus pyralis TaxID=7054 RepID=A0A1Y1KN96_PHOPY